MALARRDSGRHTYAEFLTWPKDEDEDGFRDVEPIRTIWRGAALGWGSDAWTGTSGGSEGAARSLPAGQQAGNRTRSHSESQGEIPGCETMLADTLDRSLAPCLDHRTALAAAAQLRDGDAPARRYLLQ